MPADTHDNDFDKTAPADPIAGKRLLHYRIISHIGAGGMGTVYLAQDEKLDRMVALKTLSPHLSADPSFREQLKTEARASARLTHPNICAIYAIEEAGSALFIAMEYVKGKTLHVVAREEPMSPARFVDIASQICEGLQVAHSDGIVHRDLKPSNIMLDQWSRVKIMDFGLAKITRDDSATESAGVVGTFYYMSPEQITGKPLDHRSDIFSLGAVFYELLTGKPPFKGDNVAAIAYQIAHEEIPPLSQARNDIPAGVEQIIYRALQKDVERRYQEVSEMLVDLRGVSMAPGPSISPTAAVTPFTTQTTVAVFPVRALRSDEDTQYLAEGIYEETVTVLAKIQDIGVASSAAVERFAGSDTAPLEIAEKLKVNHILEGKLQRHGDDLRLSLQLTRVRDGILVWSDAFTRKVADVFTLQEDIAQRVAGAMNVSFGSQAQAAVQPTRNPEAYDLYLRAKFFLKKRNKEAIESAIDNLREAIGIDPSFGAAYGQLATAYGIAAQYGLGMDRDDALQTAYDMAATAVELDPGSSQAHMALFHQLRTVNIRKAIAELRTAIALDEGNFEAHHYLAHSYVLYGHYRAAEREELVALRLDPFQEMPEALLCRIYYFLGQENREQHRLAELKRKYPDSSVTAATAGWLAWCRRDWGEAIEWFEKAHAIAPNNFRTLDYLADCYHRIDELDKAVDLLAEPVEKTEQEELKARLAHIYGHMGRTEDADRLFDEVLEATRNSVPAPQREQSGVYWWNMAWLSVLREDVDSALDQLAKAIASDYGHYQEFKVRPDWDILRENDRFQQMVSELEQRKRGEDG